MQKYIYWVIQLLSWGLMWLHQIVVSLVLDAYSNTRTLISGLSIGLALGLTHTFRLHYKSSLNFEQSFRQQIGKAIIWAGTFALFSTFFSYYLSSYFISGKIPNFINLRFAAIFFNWLLLYGLWFSAYHVYHFGEQLKAQSWQKWQAEKALQATETALLQLQLNPHFLFNALNSLRALLLTNPALARRGCRLLRELLSQGYHKTGFGMIRLVDEMAVVEKYIALEQLRFGEHLQFEIDWPQSARDTRLPAGTVLTLVENAVKYGQKSSLKQKVIQLRLWFEGQEMRLEVENPGQFHPKSSQVGFGGLGLPNLQRRLAYYFGKQYLFDIRQKNSERVQAALWMRWDTSQ